jgi:deazaflavin-dependent oxidoreductase (nitroreductase family)
MIETGAGTNAPPKVNRFQKFGLAVQVFLLRRGWMGPAENFLMVITTTGRKTGRSATIPIAYKREGDDIIALNPGNSNWFRNVLANRRAVIEVNRQRMTVSGSLVENEAERQRIFGMYRSDDPKVFERIFKLLPSAPEEELQAELRKWQFVRFKKSNQ